MTGEPSKDSPGSPGPTIGNLGISTLSISDREFEVCYWCSEGEYRYPSHVVHLAFLGYVLGMHGAIHPQTDGMRTACNMFQQHMTEGHQRRLWCSPIGACTCHGGVFPPRPRWGPDSAEPLFKSSFATDVAHVTVSVLRDHKVNDDEKW